jgi:hypothetical protein
VVNRGADPAVAQYRELKRTNPNGYDFGEGALNRFGYLLLEKGPEHRCHRHLKAQPKGISQVRHVYDSLAAPTPKTVENNRPSSITCKSLGFDPKNQSAVDRLKELEQK